MAQSTYDPCLLFTPGNPENKQTTGFGVVGMQTDDTLLLADSTFAEIEENELRKAQFLSQEREELTVENPIKFNRGQLTMKENSLELTQEWHCQNLGAVLHEAVNLTSSRGVIRKSVLPKGQYIAQRARGAYIATVCQPEAAYDLSTTAQVTSPTEQDEKKLNKRLKWQSDNVLRGLRFVPLKTEASLRLIVFTDASFANNADLSSQIGYVIALADTENMLEGRLVVSGVIYWSRYI
jgi:hypothetical protein